MSSRKQDMQIRPRPESAVLLACLLACPLLGQEPDAAATARLVKALETMQSLDSLRYACSQEMDTAMDREIRRQSGRVDVSFLDGPSADGLVCTLAGGVLHVTSEDTDQKIALAMGRMIARDAQHDWSLRRDKLADGSPAPFLFMPDTFFAMLLDLAPSVVHTEVGTRADRPVETLTVTVEGEQALELWNSGELPQVPPLFKSPSARQPAPRIRVDISFDVDPALSLVQKVKIRSYQAPGPGAGVTVAVGMATMSVGVGKAAEDEGESGLDAEPSGYEDGLPVRALGKLDLVKLDVTFSEHGEAAGFELDERARRLLGIHR